ncbi:hypothetical protein MHYP_G00285580 [Metynnis hypsauchen]
MQTKTGPVKGYKCQTTSLEVLLVLLLRAQLPILRIERNNTGCIIISFRADSKSEGLGKAGLVIASLFVVLKAIGYVSGELTASSAVKCLRAQSVYVPLKDVALFVLQRKNAATVRSFLRQLVSYPNCSSSCPGEAERGGSSTLNESRRAAAAGRVPRLTDRPDVNAVGEPRGAACGLTGLFARSDAAQPPCDLKGNTRSLRRSAVIRAVLLIQPHVTDTHHLLRTSQTPKQLQGQGSRGENEQVALYVTQRKHKGTTRH